jgi:enoyl-CoA hydratase/carnithine racemase
MTLPMNIRIAYKDAKIGFVFSRRGLIMEACSSYFLPRLVGHSRAMKAITTGATYLASDKVWDGLFSDLVDKPEDVLPKALEVAEEQREHVSYEGANVQGCRKSRGTAFAGQQDHL